MSSRTVCFGLLLAALVSVAAAAAVGSAETSFSDAVTSLAVCAPFTVLLTPSADDNTSVRVSDNLVGVLDAQVNNGVLAISYAKTATLDTAIHVTIEVPNKDDFSLSLLGAAAAVVRGFSWTSFSANLAGASRLLAANVTADSLGLSLAGAGGADVDGEFGAVTLNAAGNGKAVVRGVTESASLSLMGAGSALIAPASDAVTIDATVMGAGTVEYTQGKCTVSGMGSFNSECEQTSDVPEQPAATWSCGYEFLTLPTSACIADNTGDSSFPDDMPGMPDMPTSIDDFFNSRRLRMRKLLDDVVVQTDITTVACTSSESELAVPS
ncbi:hypothetical protein ABPG75_010503 [Micractinium tetrahymenae]